MRSYPRSVKGSRAGSRWTLVRPTNVTAARGHPWYGRSTLLGPNREQGIHARRAERRNETRSRGDECNEHRDATKCEWIMRAQTEQHRRQKPRRHARDEQTSE